MGIIDLNAIDGGECAAAAAEEEAGVLCLELWHACAGPLVSLPRKGSVVVYLPQGHIEQTVGEESRRERTVFDAPPHVLCRVIDVQLRAEVATDEVYAQLSLVAEGEDLEQRLREGMTNADADEDETDDIGKSASLGTPHMFCKTLTASDTSTHGGFSVPRRAAEDCFPPLDYKQQRPSQELVTKDLHGTEWRFRHIYRGQPRRHLLTTGWSAFVNKKKLVSGDAVLFMRGDNGELRLGIRRAAQLKNTVHSSPLYDQTMNLNSLSTVAGALSTKSVFHILYNPRASPSDYIIPYWKFSKRFNYPFSVGMRFKMCFETEDSAERRCTGVITGIGDIDPIRWPGSKWRCLMVRWDDDMDRSRTNRVSPWEIELSGSVSNSNSFAPISKRTKISLPSVKAVIPVPGGRDFSDFGESLRFQKVLQGQEIIGSRTSYDGNYASSHQSSSDVNNLGNGVGVMFGNSDTSYKSMGFGESLQFHKVLQGQEIFPLEAPHNSSPSSVLMFQQASTHVPCNHSMHGVNDRDRVDGISYCGSREPSRVARTGRGGCKLFGFHLTNAPATSEVELTLSGSPLSNEMNMEDRSVGHSEAKGILRHRIENLDRHLPTAALKRFIEVFDGMNFFS